jgi:hypothetical protein
MENWKKKIWHIRSFLRGGLKTLVAFTRMKNCTYFTNVLHMWAKISPINDDEQCTLRQMMAW